MLSAGEAFGECLLLKHGYLHLVYYGGNLLSSPPVHVGLKPNHVNPGGLVDCYFGMLFLGAFLIIF